MIQPKVLESIFSWRSLLLVLLAGSCIVNVLLARQVNALRQRLTNASNRGLHIGAQLPATIEGRSLDDLPVTVELVTSQRPTILYVVRAGCAWCTRNAANFMALAKHVKDTHQVIVLAQDAKLEPLKAYMGKEYPTMPVVWDLPQAFLRMLGGTPQTIVLSATGVVEWNWFGAYAPETLDEIQSVFGVKLPGLPAR